MRRGSQFTLSACMAALATAGTLWLLVPTSSAEDVTDMQSQPAREAGDLDDFKVGSADVPGPKLDKAVTIDDVYEALRKESNQSEHPHRIGSAPPPADLVELCRESPSSDPSCGVVLAMADGQLEPGGYSDEELATAVEAAGYEWRPSS